MMMTGIIVFRGIRERNGDSGGREEIKLTDNSNPMVRARFLTSSKSNSTDGSLVVLFSQCHNKGPRHRKSSEKLSHHLQETTYPG